MSEFDDAIAVSTAKRNVLNRFPWSIVAENDYRIAQAKVDSLANQPPTEVAILNVKKSNRRTWRPRDVSRDEKRGGFNRHR